MQYLVSLYYASGTALGAWDTCNHNGPCPHGAASGHLLRHWSCWSASGCSELGRSELERDVYRKRERNQDSHCCASRMQVLPRVKDSWMAGWSLLVSNHVEGSPQASAPAWKTPSGVFPHGSWERCRKGQVGGGSPYEEILCVCMCAGAGDGSVRKGTCKALQGLMCVPLRDTECTWPSFPKEYRCLAWSQMDFTGTLSLAIFTSRQLNKTSSSSSA